jgi:hypothetical protein
LTANGKNLKELTLQWEQRKHRLNEYLNITQNEEQNDDTISILPSVNDEEPFLQLAM